MVGSKIAIGLPRMSMRKHTAGQKRDIKAIAARSDEDIDFSDALSVSDWSGAEGYNDAFGLRCDCLA
jgi:hypothetical protein